ncbi:MAG: hypothetical protein L3K03_07155 [Thermoplasmata archaeon]|nr:hypothetical protein [Thermoplasmata archaeon]
MTEALEPKSTVARMVSHVQTRYVRAAFRHPSLFWEGVRNPDFYQLLRRAEDMEWGSPVMRQMKEAAQNKSETTFPFRGRPLSYLYHPHNYTWGNERGVEVPIARQLIDGHPPDQVLEIGNVLANYGAFQHTVVDKYEIGPGIINEDVATYVPSAPVELVLSVSTFEHIGWDEFPRERDKIPRTIERVRRWLAPAGWFWITVPLGYNRWLDRLIRDGLLGASEQWYFRRISFDNRWEPCSLDDAYPAVYGSPVDREDQTPPYPRANQLGVFGFRAAGSS